MSEDVREHIGELLRGLRCRRGLSLSQVQDLTSRIDWPVSRSRLSLLERGEIDIHLTDLYPLSRTYGFAIGALISEAIVAHSKKKFAAGLDAKELFENAKELFRVGRPLEAAWAFDEAGRRAADGDSDFRHLCMISAGHSYERVGAFELALGRVERVVDEADEHGESFLRAIAKAATLRAKTAAYGRAKLYLARLESVDSRKLSQELRGFLLSTRAEILDRMGDSQQAALLSRNASRVFQKLGDPDRIAKTLAFASRCQLKARPKDASSALRIARDSASFLESRTQVEVRIFVLLALGETLYAVQDLEESRKHLEDAAELATKHGFHDEAAESCVLLQRIASQLGDTKSAVAWQRKLGALADLLGASKQESLRNEIKEKRT